jgi:uncharacterized RDD family membrane protein YckC
MPSGQVRKGKVMEVQKSDETISSKMPENELAILASRAQRFGTYILDYIFVILFSCIIGVMLGVFLGLTGIKLDLESKVTELIFGVIAVFIYYFFQEAFWGKTLGKLIIGTKILNNDYTKVSVKNAFARTICRFIPFEAFSFLGGDSKPQGWHDKLSNTIVVLERKNVQRKQLNTKPHAKG